MLRVLLEMRGCRVVEAEDGAAAIEIAESSRPDLILIDARLPLLDGLSATRCMRRQADLRQVPIIAVSADPAASFKADAVAAGCNDCLGKPIDFERFEMLVNHYVNAAPDNRQNYSLALRPIGYLSCYAGS